MNRKKYDIVAKTGSYQNAQGETKNRYQNVGAVIQGDNGPYLMLAKWFNPAGVPDDRGGESVLLSLFEPRDPNQQGQAAQSAAAPAQAQRSAPAAKPAAQGAAGSNFDDEIPF